MKEHRNDASRASADSANEHAGRRHQGDNAHLSARDRAGRRVSQLDNQQREGVADEALEDASGAVPYRDEMEQRFGRSFGDVRVADGARNREALDEVGADGVARDNTIAFRDESPSREAVAHELTHVAQAGASPTGSRQDAEREAFGAERGQGAIDVSAGVGAGVAHFRDSADSGMANLPMSPFPREQFRPTSTDEKFPIDWRHMSKAVPDPFQNVDCIVKGDAPPAPDKLEEPKKRSDGHGHPSHHRPRDPIDWDNVPNFGRYNAWTAFTAASVEAQSKHEQLGVDIEAFRHAEKDDQLRALGFVLGKSSRTDIESITNEQQIPQRGGATIGSLFDGNNNLKLGKHDQQAINQSGQAMQRGKGKIEGARLDTIGADSDVQSHISNVAAAARHVKQITHDHKATLLEIEVEKHLADSDAAQDEIDEIKAGMAKIKGVFDALFATASGVVFAVGGDYGDAINQIGVLGGMILDRASGMKIEAAENKLRAARKGMRSAKAQALQERLNGVNEEMVMALHAVRAAREALEKAMTDRRKAYNASGVAAAEQVSGPESSRNKIAAILAAIPLVEMVIARARNIANHKGPAYTEDAGRGVGIASFHKLPEAGRFLRACAELNYSHTYFALMAGEWQDRLDGLLEVQTRISGHRPGS